MLKSKVMKHVVIIGGGFAGVRLARKLGKQKNDIHVTLVNDSDDFRYCPTLWRSAVGYKMGISRLPLEWTLLDIPNVTLVIDRATSVDREKRKIKLQSGNILDYDEAVFCVGVVSTFFNIEGLHEHAYGIKSPDEIIRLRKHLHSLLMRNDLPSQNFVIAGGGPTGVELAAGLGHYLKFMARRHKRSRKKINIYLVEGAPRLLPVMSERAGKLALKHLKKIGVKVMLNTKVTRETVHSLKTSEGTIPTSAVIWTAGTFNNPFFAENHDVFPLNERGRVKVNDYLQVDPHIYVIGDNAATKYSGLAFTAINNANFVASDLKRRSKHGKRKHHKPVKPPQVLPLGNRTAILEYGKFTMGGFLPALIRKFADLVGYADVLGYRRAYDVWRASDTTENDCPACAMYRS